MSVSQRCASLTHIAQLDDWDCGIACLQMVLAAKGRNTTRSELVRLIATESVWTVDLCWVLCQLQVPFRMFTTSLHVRDEYRNLGYYQEEIDCDSQRIARRVRELEAVAPLVGTIQERSLTVEEYAKRIVDDECMALTLLCVTKLKCWWRDLAHINRRDGKPGKGIGTANDLQGLMGLRIGQESEQRHTCRDHEIMEQCHSNIGMRFRSLKAAELSQISTSDPTKGSTFDPDGNSYTGHYILVVDVGVFDMEGTSFQRVPESKSADESKRVMGLESIRLEDVYVKYLDPLIGSSKGNSESSYFCYAPLYLIDSARRVVGTDEDVIFIPHT